MQETLHRLLNGVHYDDAAYIYSGRDINAIADLIEALRNVARGLEAARNLLAYEPYYKSDIDNKQALLETLDALPAWVLME